MTQPPTTQQPSEEPRPINRIRSNNIQGDSPDEGLEWARMANVQAINAKISDLELEIYDDNYSVKRLLSLLTTQPHLPHEVNNVNARIHELRMTLYKNNTLAEELKTLLRTYSM